MKNVVIFCFVLCSKFVWGQTVGLYHLTQHINGENGLPQNTIRDACFSKNNFLWLATEDGLVRYDGKNIRVYNRLNSELTQNRITQLIPTLDGHLYCVNQDYNLYEILEIDHHIDLVYHSKLNFLGFNAYHLFAASSLHRFKQICGTILPENFKYMGNHVFFMLHGTNTFAQRSSKGLLFYTPDLKVSKEIKLPVSSIQSMFRMDSVIFYRDDKQEVYKINTSTNTYQKTGSKLEGSLIINEKEGTAFLHNNQTLSQLSFTNNQIHQTILLSDFKEKLITSISFSPKQTELIIGTASNGFFVYRKQLFQVLKEKEGDNIFYNILKNHKGDGILSGRHLTELSPTKNYSHSKLSISGNSIVSWNKGVICKIDEQLRYLPITTNEKPQFIDSTKKDLHLLYKHNDSILFIITDDKISLWNSKQKPITLITLPKMGMSFRIYHMEQDSLPNQFLLATSVGLWRFDASQNTIDTIGLKDVVCRTIFRTSSGYYLIGTYGAGIYAYFKNHFVKIPLDKNQLLITAHSFQEDQQHALWISSNNGLFQIPLKSISKYLVHGENLIYYKRYTVQDGLLTNEFNGGCFPNSQKLGDSILCFPSMNGVVWVKPNIISKEGLASIFINEILLDDKKVNIKYSNLLSPENHKFKLSVFLTTANWGNDNNVLIRYRLNDDSTWVILTKNENPIVIQNLNGGLHTLHIERFDPDEETSQEISLRIKVPYLIYERSWFIPLLILLFLLGIFSFYKISNYYNQKKKLLLEKLVREKTNELHHMVKTLETQNEVIAKSRIQLHEENEHKSTLLMLLSHDIATPLRFMNRYLGAFTKEKETEIPTPEDLVDLKVSAENLENLLSTIVTWVKQRQNARLEAHYESIDLRKLVETKIKLFELTCKRKHISCENNITENTIIFSDHFIISTAIQNILSNAINFTKNGSIRFLFLQQQEEFRICIEDEGPGFINVLNEQVKNDKETITGFGIGLQVTRELLRLIQGFLEIHTVKEKTGTTVCIVIKTVNNKEHE